MTSDNAKTKLLFAAGPIFAEKGYEGSTVREICEAAGVNLASVNYHFGEKERLYIETVKLAQRLRDEQAPFRTMPPDSAPEDRLREFVATMLTRMLSEDAQPWQQRLMMREMLSPTDACRELAEEQFRPVFERLVDVIAELGSNSLSRLDCRRYGFGIIGQCIHYKVAGHIIDILTPPEEIAAQRDVPALTSHIVSTTLAALKQHDSISKDVDNGAITR